MNTCEHDFDYILDGNWECTKCAAEFSDEDKKDWQYQHLEQQLTQAQQTIEEQKELTAKYAEINRECEEEILSLESVIQTLKQQLGESRERELAPVDNGIKELDGFCEKYNKGEIDLCGLVCRTWNTALNLNNQ